jgi:hypothetical protein
MNIHLFPAIPMVALLLSSPVHSGNYEPRDILVNMSEEAIECASFFVLASSAMGNAGRQQESDGYFEVSKNYLQYAQGLASQAGQLPETVNATLNMIHQEHLERIGHDLANFAILSETYLPLCPGVLSDPEGRFQYWRGRLGIQ